MDTASAVPSLLFTCKVRDSLHGTIAFTEVEKAVIDTPEFQRLRRIGQTSFVKYVFPGATHSRFEHSLGTMHLAGLMYARLAKNQRRLVNDLREAVSHLDLTASEWFLQNEERNGSILGTESALEFVERDAYLFQCVRLAALLHDVGHAPFSHSSEKFLPTWQELVGRLEEFDVPEWLRAHFLRSHETHRKNSPASARLRHEAFTLLIAHRIFVRAKFPFVSSMCRDVLAILETDIEPAPESPLVQHGLRELLHELISGEIDVDRMDYLLRDTRQCGVVYGLFDLERLLDSTSFYRDARGVAHLAIRKSGLPAFEDYLRARLSMYQQVYFHKTATACQAMLESAHRDLGRFTLPLDLEGYLALDDASFLGFLEGLAGKESFGLSILRDLLLNRRLWKRVYEENIPRHVANTTPSLCPAILAVLARDGYPCGLIEDKTSLTRFAPRGRRSQSENVLRVIVKNVYSLRYLEPIENHSGLVNRMDEENVIRRVYVARSLPTGEDVEGAVVQQRISSMVIDPGQGGCSWGV